MILGGAADREFGFALMACFDFLLLPFVTFSFLFFFCNLVHSKHCTATVIGSAGLLRIRAPLPICLVVLEYVCP